jgi:HAMP domain-containing protein
MAIQLNAMRLKSDLVAWSRQLTWPWLAALALLAACLGFYLSVVVPAQNTLADLKQNLDVMQYDETHLKQASQDVDRTSPTGQLETFYEKFPAESTVPDTLEKMIKLAQKKGLNPKQAAYRIVRNNPGELLSYQISLPIKGAYPSIMTYAFELLASIPNLALDNVSFQRQKIGDNLIEATLKMTLYIKRQQAGGQNK